MKAVSQSAALYHTHGLHLSPCKACMRCKNTGICVLDDDLRLILNQFAKADTVILAAPVYAADINVDMKVFLERSHSLIPPNMGPFPSPGNKLEKNLILVLSQGSPPEYHEEIPEKYKQYFRALGVMNQQTVRACNVPSNSDFSPNNYLEEIGVCDRLISVMSQGGREIQ